MNGHATTLSSPADSVRSRPIDRARRVHLAMWLLSMAAFGPTIAFAQPRAAEPHLAYAFPAGCQRGLSREVVLGGQHIKDAKGVYVAGGGVEAEIVKWYRPMTRGEFNQLRMKHDEARQKLIDGGNAQPTEDEVATAAGITAEQRREMEIYRQRDRDAKRQPNDQLEEELTVKVTVADDAEPGRRELRLMSESAISNPLWLHVGQLAEVVELEPNDLAAGEPIATLPVVVNGQIMPGDVDRIAFQAKQGAKLVIVAGAREVIPYLADAVPGWFQPTIGLADSTGREMRLTGAFHFHQDPVAYFEVPRDDCYTLAIHDALYRGREDFVYRATIGEIPFVTSMFPLGARADEKTTIQLEGWNLTQKTLQTQLFGAKQQHPLHWYSVEQGAGQSVRIPVKTDTLTEVVEKEPNNSPSTAQPVSTPVIVNGRIDAPGDEDVFRLSGAGKLAIEVYARRHGSPLDSLVILTDVNGKELAFNDDYEDKSQGLLTHHADSHLVATIPASGALLRLGDAQGNGGPEFAYRLYLRSPKPDFELRVTPASILARPGAIVPITVHALRNDEFAEDIEVGLVNASAGFGLSGAVIPGKASRVQMTLSVPGNATHGPVTLEMVGRALAKRTRTTIMRPAIPAESMMQAFIWNHLIPVENWNVMVSGGATPRFPFDIVLPNEHVDLPNGGDAFLPLRATTKNVDAADLHFEVKEPKGITAGIVADSLGNLAIRLTVEDNKSDPGSRGNVLIVAYRLTTPKSTADNPNPKPWRSDYGYLPAVPYESTAKKTRAEKTK